MLIGIFRGGGGGVYILLYLPPNFLNYLEFEIKPIVFKTSNLLDSTISHRIAMFFNKTTS